MKKRITGEQISNISMFIIGVFINALCFNMFLNPQNLVVSGFSGVSIVVEQIFGLSPSTFLLITNILLLVVCYFALGWKETKINILGSIIYPLFISLTGPLSVLLVKFLATNDFILILLFAIITYGFSNGLIYRGGYATGGSDIIMLIISKYCNVSHSKANIFANAFVIICGVFVFGIEKGTYSLIILLTSSYFIDKMMFGISDSKLFYIYSKRIRKLKKVILNEFQSGFTTLSSKGGYSKKDGVLIMCVVANNDYYKLKQRILEIDPRAFIVITKCYEVNGGVKRSNVPFF